MGLEIRVCFKCVELIRGVHGNMQHVGADIYLLHETSDVSFFKTLFPIPT